MEWANRKIRFKFVKWNDATKGEGKAGKEIKEKKRKKSREVARQKKKQLNYCCFKRKIWECKVRKRRKKRKDV